MHTVQSGQVLSAVYPLCKLNTDSFPIRGGSIFSQCRCAVLAAMRVVPIISARTVTQSKSRHRYVG